MTSYEKSLKQRLKELKKLKVDLSEVMYQAQKEATLKAVSTAAENTPPKDGDIRGTNTISGELKAHWSTDSETEPKQTDKGYETVLANNVEYASYVNDGHRMDKHFVPGLYVNPYSGLLEYDPTAEVGLTVGAKTKYVKGEFMKEKAIEAYEKTVLEILDRRIQEAFK